MGCFGIFPVLGIAFRCVGQSSQAEPVLYGVLDMEHFYFTSLYRLFDMCSSAKFTVLRVLAVQSVHVTLVSVQADNAIATRLVFCVYFCHAPLFLLTLIVLRYAAIMCVCVFRPN